MTWMTQNLQTSGIVLPRSPFCVSAEVEAAVQTAAEPHPLYPCHPVYLWNCFLSCFHCTTKRYYALYIKHTAMYGIQLKSECFILVHGAAKTSKSAFI